MPSLELLLSLHHQLLYVRMTTLINCRGKLIDLAQPRVMGILNITPDSFFERSRVHTETEILNQAEKMLSAGATFLDLGGHSTRPGATPVSEEEEIKRVLPATEIILKHFPEALISLDTFYAETVKFSFDEGLDIVAVQITSLMGKVSCSENEVFAEAGIWVPKFARKLAQFGLSGAEHICGIPGTLGGLIYMNGGSQRRGIGENIVEVSATVPFTSQLVWWLRSFGKKLLNIEPAAVYNAVREVEENTQ